MFQHDGEASDAAFRYAETLASASGGTIEGMMFALTPLAVYGNALDMSADLWVAAQETAKAEAAARWERLRPLFDSCAATANLRRVEALEGEAAKIFALHGRFWDAIVLGWSKPEASPLEREIFTSALFESGRPAIVVPSSGVARPPRRALVAWTPTREATRALHDALPLLRRMESVRVAIIDEGEAGSDSGAGVEIARHLARHQAPVEVNLAPRGGVDTADAILREARFFGADLIVLGGYGHSRTREWVFGGVTRDILDRATLPLFISH